MDATYPFNPDHDMALAAHIPHYVAPRHIRQMADDLASLPRWYANPDDQGIHPWGWDIALAYRLRKAGVPDDCLPTTQQLDTWRNLSHRATAARMLEVLTAIPGTTGLAQVCHEADEVARFVANHHHAMLKAPWSGSGRGLRQACHPMTAPTESWVRRTLRQQQAVTCEPLYDKACDFAMEFCMRGKGHCQFAGYSLFQTDPNGHYLSNRLAPDHAIRQQLLTYGIPIDDVRTRLCQLLAELPYVGPLGVDMMVCQTPQGFRLHPCVEINFRMSMGLLSRRLFDRHCTPESRGHYWVKYHPTPGQALRFHECAANAHPATFDATGRMAGGYHALTPIGPDTHYQAYILLD